jgi:hypothetical protein
MGTWVSHFWLSNPNFWVRLRISQKKISQKWGLGYPIFGFQTQIFLGLKFPKKNKPKMGTWVPHFWLSNPNFFRLRISQKKISQKWGLGYPIFGFQTQIFLGLKFPKKNKPKMGTWVPHFWLSNPNFFRLRISQKK